MEFLVAGVFLCLGLRKILSYRRRPKALGARHGSLLFGLPQSVIIAVGLFEVAAALVLIVPFGSMPGPTLALLAASALAFLTVAAGIYHVRRQESAAPSVALFLLALFVIVEHTL